MIFITGMRRVGKSTLMKQMIQHLIDKSKVSPEQIVIWEWSRFNTSQELQDLFQSYLDQVGDPKKLFYFFMDEIQYIDGFEGILKLFYDRYENLRIVLTGSLSLYYKRRMNESLAGRFVPFGLLPLNFEEYLDFSCEKGLEKFTQAKNELNPNLKQGLAKELNIYFRKFLLSGRFPDTIEYTNNQDVSTYIQSIITQSLNQDSIDYFNITKPRQINLLYTYLAQNNGSEISLQKLSNQLSIAWVTVKEYLDILELLGLIYPVFNTDNPLKLTQARQKIYLNSAFSLCFQDSNLDINLGLAVESYILERMLEQKQKVYFYRHRNAEVDLINYNQKIAWEVKFRSQIKARDVLNLQKISQKLSLDSHLISMFQTVSDFANISYTPACLF